MLGPRPMTSMNRPSMMSHSWVEWKSFFLNINSLMPANQPSDKTYAPWLCEIGIPQVIHLPQWWPRWGELFTNAAGAEMMMQQGRTKPGWKKIEMQHAEQRWWNSGCSAEGAGGHSSMFRACGWKQTGWRFTSKEVKMSSDRTVPNDNNWTQTIIIQSISPAAR